MKNKKEVVIPLKKPITKCKNCGKMGHLVRYSDGSSCMQHKIVAEVVFGMVAPHVVKSCFFKSEEQ